MANEERSEEQTTFPGQVNIGLMTTVGVMAITAAILLIGACTGFYQVQPGEAAAIQTFGAARAEPVSDEGLHWHWPSPIGRTTVVQVEKSRTTEVGWQTLPDGKIDFRTGENWQRDLDAATMITGDLNLLENQLVAHYYISDLNQYLFAADDPGYVFVYHENEDDTREHRSHSPNYPDGQSLKDALEIAIRRSVGQKTIDEALVLGRETIERETMEHAQGILNDYRTGLTISSVQLQEVKPPDEVQAAFDDVLQAREEKERRINQALAFESQTLPEARGNAERIRKEAVAYEAQRVNAAAAEAGRFLNILAEYRAAPGVIAERMYLETLDAVLPRTRQILAVGDGTIILNIDGSGQVLPVETSTSASTDTLPAQELP